MKVLYPAFLAAALLGGCAPSASHRADDAAEPKVPRDSIDRLVAACEANQHSGGGEVFPSGMATLIPLPATATAKEVASQALHGSKFTMLAARKVRIQDQRMAGLKLDPDYTAILVATDSQKKIVLIQFWPLSKGWWNRVYDAK